MNYAIIAAGEGSRLVQEGIKRPKPLVELNGVALIDRLIAIFLRNRATAISIIINEEMQEVKKHLQALQLDIPLNLVIKSTPDSMHSFYELRNYLQERKFCLTTVDTIFKENEFAAFIRTFEADEEQDGMMAVTAFIDDEKPLYVSIEENTSTIRDFLDTSNGDEKYVSGGIYCLTSAAIRTLDRCVTNGTVRMRNYQRQLIKDGLKLKACSFSKIVDVDHAGDIAKAEELIANENEN
jgi:NDP-sugar pyrophosphorylase family protein